MPTLPRVYRYLAESDDPAADEALVAACKDLEGNYLRAAVQVLLQRAQPVGLLAAIEQYHRLGDDLAQLVRASAASLAGVLRTAVRSGELQTRINSLELAAQLGDESLAYLFDLGLMDPQPRVREMAAGLVRRAALRLLADHPLLREGQAVRPATQERATQEGVSPPQDATGPAPCPCDAPARLALRRQHLFETLLSGVHRYDVHLRPEVIEACMWFEPYLGEPFWRFVRQPRSRFVRLLADLMLSSDEPASAMFALAAIGLAQLRPHAVRVICERRDPCWFRGVLRGAELWHAWPRLRKGWATIKQIAYLQMLKRADWPSLAGYTGLPILVAASGLSGPSKQTIIDAFMEFATPEARRQVLFEAARARDWGARLLRSVLRQSADRSEVRTAAYALLQAGYEGLAADLARRLATPDDPAAADLAPLAADLILWRLWTLFDAMQEQPRVAALGLIKGCSQMLRTRLRVMMASTSMSARLRAVRIAGLLDLADVLSRDMLFAAQDPNARVRSAAVRFFGRCQCQALHEQLRLALDDPDPRVQANAVEAVDEAAWPDRLSLIVPKLHSDNNRIRAVAARALVRAGSEQAVHAVLAMLDDPRAQYRLTALWTIRMMAPGHGTDRLAHVAREDPSATVRRYARLVLTDLQQRAAVPEHARS